MSDVFGPFNVAPRVLQRSTNFVDLIVNDRPGTDMYQLWGAKSVNDAYGDLQGTTPSGVVGAGPTAMMTVLKDAMGQSVTVVKRGWHIEENRRGQTSFQFDPDDYVAPATPPPFRGDNFPVYVRLQEYRAGSWLAVSGAATFNPGVPILGPILAVPPVSFYGRSTMGTMIITGIAPAGTGCTVGDPPLVDPTVQTPLPMHIILPKTCASVRITAETAGKTVLMSQGLGDPMLPVQNDHPFLIDSAVNHGINEIVLAGLTSAAPFTIYAAMAHVGA